MGVNAVFVLTPIFYSPTLESSDKKWHNKMIDILLRRLNGMKQEVYNELSAITENNRLYNIEKLRADGVLIPCTDGVIIGNSVTVGAGTLLLKGTVLLGTTQIGTGCFIGPDCLLYNTYVGNEAKLNAVQSFDAKICNKADLGPFVHIRPDSVVGEEVHLGNFVEIKNSVIGKKTSVSHLTYVGDSDVGEHVNFGCGCVTVNFNGKTKSRTTVGNHCFIGCNTNLVAPVTIGDYAYTAAGSTVTEDVPENALAIARARQENKDGWVTRKKPYRNMD